MQFGLNALPQGLLELNHPFRIRAANFEDHGNGTRYRVDGIGQDRKLANRGYQVRTLLRAAARELIHRPDEIRGSDEGVPPKRHGGGSSVIGTALYRHLMAAYAYDG